LYAKARKQLFEDDGALLSLYKSRYPDPEIEKRLMARLYETAPNDTDWRRRDIVNAFRDVGTVAVLPTLEAILFDQTPSLQVKQMILKAIESAGVYNADAMLASFETGSRKTFLTLVAKAIETIRERGDKAAEKAALAGGQRRSEHEETEQKAELQNAE